MQTGIEADDHIHRRLSGCVVHGGHEGGKQGAGRFRFHVDGQIFPQLLRIIERPLGRLFLNEEIERIVNRHIGDKIDLDLKFRRRLGKNETGEIIAVRVLLKVHEMI